MNRSIQFKRSSEEPVFAGTYRFLLGLAIMFAGLYIAVLSDFQGHGLGFFLIFASPFVIFKDNTELQPSECLQK